jgi:hypothetical protein
MWMLVILSTVLLFWYIRRVRRRRERAHEFDYLLGVGLGGDSNEAASVSGPDTSKAPQRGLSAVSYPLLK